MAGTVGNPGPAIGRCLLARAWFLLLVCYLASAQAYAPYAVVEAGERVSFKEIGKEHLGRLCSVFHTPGRPTGVTAVGRADPRGMVTQRGDVRIVTGELHAIGMDHIQIIGFYGADRERGGSRWHHIRADDIDYVVFREAGPGQPPAGADPAKSGPAQP